MPFDLRISNRDIVVDPFDIQLNTVGLEAVAQRITIQLNTFRGEYFLDTDFGTPYYQTILRKGVSLPLIESEMKKVLRGVIGVLQIIEFTSELVRASRDLRVTFKVRVDTGIVDADLNLGGGDFCMYVPPAGNNIIYIRTGQPFNAFPIGGANLNIEC